MEKRQVLKTRMVVYSVLCVALAFGSPVWSSVLRLGAGSPRAWFMAASAAGAIVPLWAALREMSRLRNSH
jgi:hypothetical protein